mgnify:CR=1 FL=1
MKLINMDFYNYFCNELLIVNQQTLLWILQNSFVGYLRTLTIGW